MEEGVGVAGEVLLGSDFPSACFPVPFSAFFCECPFAVHYSAGLIETSVSPCPRLGLSSPVLIAFAFEGGALSPKFQLLPGIHCVTFLWKYSRTFI